MKKNFCFVMAQLDFLVGDIENNAEKIISSAIEAKAKYNADLIIYPELTLTGYPPEDLLLRASLYDRVQQALEYIKTTLKNIDVLIGFPYQEGNKRYNAAGLICNGKLETIYHKNELPNYAVFDELRYFKSGTKPLVINYKDLPLGITICEDLWHKDAFLNTVQAGANLVLSINASPFDIRKHEARIAMLRNRTRHSNVPVLYTNCVGGQDELVFDGGSLVVDNNGVVYQRGPFFKEALIPVEFEYDTVTKSITFEQCETQEPLSVSERAYQALVLGVKDYIEKNHFPQAIIGLSGGIDSALTLAIAVDAIGADRVEGVIMPSRYTSQMSIDLALEQAKNHNVKTSLISIEPVYSSFLNVLATEFEGLPQDMTEENLQARCRGSILMAISNKKGAIVLSTGNKSELAVGYCTLYGDMVGGFCVLKDIPKTMVYDLVKYRNSIAPVIPADVIQREPSAELAKDQKDSDTLPPYALLDQILELYIERDRSAQEIIARGFDKEIVRKVILMVDRNEYKRRQAPLGVKISTRAFGRDRRYPITSGYSRYLRI